MQFRLLAAQLSERERRSGLGVGMWRWFYLGESLRQKDRVCLDHVGLSVTGRIENFCDSEYCRADVRFRRPVESVPRVEVKGGILADELDVVEVFVAPSRS